MTIWDIVYSIERLVYTTCGCISPLVSWVSDIFSILDQNFFRLSPSFCFADGLASLALLRQGMKIGSSEGYFGWNVSGGSICYLAAEVRFWFSSLFTLLSPSIEFCASCTLALTLTSTFIYSTPCCKKVTKNSITIIAYMTPRKLDKIRFTKRIITATSFSSLSKRHWYSELEYSFGTYWNQFTHIFFLLWQGIIYFLLTLGLEFFPPHKLNVFALKDFLRRFRRTSQTFPDAYSEPFLRSSTESAAIDLDEDIDVQTERKKVLSGSIDRAIIYLRNLRKVLVTWLVDLQRWYHSLSCKS